MRVRADARVHAKELDEFENRGLTPLRWYLVVGVSDRHYRIMDDNGEPTLYPRYLFDGVSGEIPADWSTREFSDGEFYADPNECAEPGFYEDYFDHRPEARATFEQVLRRVSSAD